jgi:hypothetical protein
MHSASPELMAQGYRSAPTKGSMDASFQRAPAQTLPELTACAQRPLRPYSEPSDARDGGSERHHGTAREIAAAGSDGLQVLAPTRHRLRQTAAVHGDRIARELSTDQLGDRARRDAHWYTARVKAPLTHGELRHNVGVDRHAAALRREAYAHQHASRRNDAACPRRTTC